jgi:uncharacterized protein
MTPPAEATTVCEADRQGRVLGILDGSGFGAANGGRRIDTHASVVFLGGERALKLARRALAQGCSVVLDASFMQQTQRTGLFDLARRHNARFVGLFLTADLETRLARIEQRKHDASDATRDIALKQEVSEIGAIDWHVIDVSGTPDDTLRRSMAWLSAPGPASRDGR